MSKVLDILKKTGNFLKSHKIFTVVMSIVLVFVILGIMAQNYQKNKELNNTEVYNPVDSNNTINVDVPSEANNSQGSTTDSASRVADLEIMQRQSALVARYGAIPEGYLWDMNGNILSQGDKSMSAEDVLSAYLNGAKTLDFSTVQKYSRGSKVYSTYSSYFKDNRSGSQNNFQKEMYRLALLSLNLDSIEFISNFTNDMIVYTVNLELLDLSDKEFWVKDKKEIYEMFYLYGSIESDQLKAQEYVYDYILNYYRSPEAKKRTVRIDIKVEKFPDLDTGWLVSSDVDIDAACRYSEGMVIYNYIKQLYSSEGKDVINNGN